MAHKFDPFGSRKVYLQHCKQVNRLFLDGHRRNVYIRYVREVPPVQVTIDGESGDVVSVVQQHGRGRPTAVLVAYKHQDGTMTYGWSAAHTTREKVFHKAVALQKAISRAVGSEDAGSLPWRLIDPMAEFRQLSARWFSPRTEAATG